MKVVIATKAKALMLLKLDFGKVIIMSTLKTLVLISIEIVNHNFLSHSVKKLYIVPLPNQTNK